MKPELLLAMIDHAAIASGYVGLGAFVSRKFDAAAPTMALRAFRLACMLFFICCALDHLDWTIHLATGTPIDMLNGFHLIVDTAQGIGSLVAVVLGLAFISLRIFDRTYYGGVLDRAIDAEAHRVARERQDAGLQRLDESVRETRDVLSLIHAAITEGSPPP